MEQYSEVGGIVSGLTVMDRASEEVWTRQGWLDGGAMCNEPLGWVVFSC